MLSAWNDLLEQLGLDEKVEAIVFGNWGWSDSDAPQANAYNEPEPTHVPLDMRGIVLTPDIAMHFMEGWSFYGAYGSPECYAVRIWTNRRIFWVTQYYGSTKLNSAMREPHDHMPDMPGGG